MRSRVLAAAIAVGITAALVAPVPAAAQSLMQARFSQPVQTIDEVRSSVVSLLEIYIADLQQQRATLRLSLRDPNLTPQERRALRRELNQVRTALRGANADLVRVARMPQMHLMLLRNRLITVVSP